MSTTKHVTYFLTEGEITVRLDYKNLPDLDALMLELWREVDDERTLAWDGDDEPTRFATQHEPDWQWAKMSPCFCGEHGWHWDARSAERWQQRHLDAGLVEGEPDLIEDRPKNRFVALVWG